MTERICRKCKYDLMGVAPIGKCPECGNAYNQYTREGLRSFTDEYNRHARIAARIRTIGLAVMAVAIFAAFWAVSWVKHEPRVFWLGALFAGVTAFGTLVSFVYEKS